MRRKSKEIQIGGLFIGGGHPIAIQSMTNSDTADRMATAKQLKQLEKAGCDIARFTVNSMEAALNIPFYKTITAMPLVADIHFDYRLAMESAKAGIDKIRINPGNIGSDDRIKAVCDICREKSIPIRIGINSGSLEKRLLEKYGSPTPEAIVESAVNSAHKLEQFGFDNIVLSLKSADVKTVIVANRLLAEECDYPLHLGVTESGRGTMGNIKSAVGIGSLLCDGIGDTIRVSLTENVVKEVEAARNILRACGLVPGIDIVSCPTCGRTKINLLPLAKELEKQIKNLKTQKQIKVALMGCIVNGPGEAKEADVGVAGGVGEAMLFKKGVPCGMLDESQIIPTLVKEIKQLL